MPMTMAIVGGDARFALLAELLRAREWDVRVDPPAEQLREADGVIAQNPVKNSGQIAPEMPCEPFRNA